ncbi:hypothetical protein ACR03S_16060 (plasmid) [Limimaricola variabilis]
MTADRPLPADQTATREAAIEVAECIAETLDLSLSDRLYVALALEASAGKASSNPEYALLACMVASQMREEN